MFERDLGSALLFFVFFVVMLYVSTGRVSYVAVSLVLLAVGGVFCYHVFGHVRTRVNIWLDPWSDAQGGGYQIVQSLFSIADGGLVGSGIGKGLPTLIPVVESDFIFSAIAEESGLLGASTCCSASVASRPRRAPSPTPRPSRPWASRARSPSRPSSSSAA